VRKSAEADGTAAASSPVPQGGHRLGPKPRRHAGAFHKAWRDAVHRDGRREGDRQAAREMDDARLRYSLRDAAPHRDQPQEARDVHDASLVVASQVRGRSSCHEKRTAQVGIQQLIPDLGCEPVEILKRDRLIQRRVIDQDIETTESVDGPTDRSGA
jgi:hypothetical protein